MELEARYARWDGVGRPFTVCSTAVSSRLEPDEVLVAIDLATVCGSDLHTVSGHRSSPAPGVLGHEQVGRVVAAGADAPVEPGQRVVWSVTASCGDCPRCRRGLTQKCLRLRKYGHEPLTEASPLTGGFATHCLLMPGTTIVAVPETVPDEVAAPAACATATVAAVVAAAGPVEPGMRAMVSGAGMLGLTAVAMLAERGAYVVAVDPVPARRELALRFGAAEVAVGASSDVCAEVDVALELSGATAAVQGALASLAVGGTLVLAGSVSPGPAVGLDPERVVRGLLTVTGMHNYTAVDLQTAIDFLAACHDRYPFAELVEGAYPLEKLDDAFDAARRGPAPRQAVLPTA
ncbi:zinc-binding dehydrogenase [Actinoplanes sp. CA-131856]